MRRLSFHFGLEHWFHVTSQAGGKADTGLATSMRLWLGVLDYNQSNVCLATWCEGHGRAFPLESFAAAAW